MWKAILSGTAVLVIAGSTLVHAQQRDPRPDSFRRDPPNTEDLQAFADARLAALRAGLSLTAEQQAYWPAFEAAARELQKLRIDRASAARSQRRDARPQADNFAERMRNRGAAMADMGAALKNFADAADPLYKSLDNNQKRRFAVLSRVVDLNAYASAGSARRDRNFRNGFDRDSRLGLDLRHHFHRGFRDGSDSRRDRGDRFDGDSRGRDSR
jgi:hypothetical protein